MTPLQEMIAPDLMAEIASEIAAVEVELEHQVRSQIKLVSDVGSHTLEAGGKRLRPAFLSISAKSTGLEFDENRARLLGACMEMIHMATLIHDDVIDNAPTRRGRDTASVVFGNTASILSGDVLLAKAMSILAQDGDLEVIRSVSNAVVDMAEGEVAELETRGVFDLTEEAHIRILHLKTASFVECCCEVGARITGSPPHILKALRAYGLHVGLAFQIVDDLLDYTGDAARIGKSVATDFREGCSTLPLIYLLPKLSEAERDLARNKFGEGATDDAVALIVEWMFARGALDQARSVAESHVQTALEALEPLPEGRYKQLLVTFAKFVLSRES